MVSSLLLLLLHLNAVCFALLLVHCFNSWHTFTLAHSLVYLPFLWVCVAWIARESKYEPRVQLRSWQILLRKCVVSPLLLKLLGCSLHGCSLGRIVLSYLGCRSPPIRKLDKFHALVQRPKLEFKEREIAESISLLGDSSFVAAGSVISRGSSRELYIEREKGGLFVLVGASQWTRVLSFCLLG